LKTGDNWSYAVRTPCENFWLRQCRGPYKTRIGAHRHIGAHRGAWWLATLRHVTADDGGNMAE